MDIFKSLIIAGIRSNEINTKNFNIDFTKLIENQNFLLIMELKLILEDEKFTDFECIEKILSVFEKYNIDIEGRHDF